LDTLSLDFSTATTQTQKDAINTEREGLLIEIALADSLLADKYNARNTAIQTGLTAVYGCTGNRAVEPTEQNGLIDAMLVLQPNPANEQVLMVWKGMEATSTSTLTVTNPLGATVVQHVIPSAEGRWLMPTASLPAGLYVVRIAAADGRTMTIRKLLIKH